MPLSWARGPGPGVVLFSGVCVVGTLGDAGIEGWSLWDSVFMTVTTASTVGYGYVHPPSRAGEAWTALVLLTGVATLYYTAFVLMALVVDGGLHRTFEQRRFTRMLDQLTNHFIIGGYGRIGSTIAEEFRRQLVPHVVIERDAEKVRAIKRRRRHRRRGGRESRGCAATGRAAAGPRPHRRGLDRCRERLRGAHRPRAIVVAIRRAQGHMEFNPSPDARMLAGDQLVLLGSAEKLRQLDAAARPAATSESPA